LHPSNQDHNFQDFAPLPLRGGQLFQNVENEENRFFAITSSKLVRS
jgi:hypothetical protein